MWKGASVIKDLFFIILIWVIWFIAHNKITSDDHIECNKKIDRIMNEVVSYKNDQSANGLSNTPLWKINLWDIKSWKINPADLGIERVSTNFEKMRYSGTTRIYEASVWFSIKGFRFNVPISCSVVNWEVTIESRLN
jgi:hypothetical protein